MPKACKIYDLGCFGNCGKIEMPFVSDITGIYTILYKFRGAIRYFFVSATEGEKLSIDNVFNENSVIDFTIKYADGNLFTASIFNKDTIITEKHNKFRLKIIPAFDNSKLYEPIECLEICKNC